MRGDWEDYLLHPDGRRELVGKGQNLVVNSAYIAMAMAMKLDPAYDGFMYWAVGDGNLGGAGASPGWDAGVAGLTIQPLPTDTQLAREIYRKVILPADIKFVDSLGALTAGGGATPSNRLRITSTFTESEPAPTGTFYFREWGIFGGNATGTALSGYLINRKVHTTYEKTNLAQLQRQLTFTF